MGLQKTLIWQLTVQNGKIEKWGVHAHSLNQRALNDYHADLSQHRQALKSPRWAIFTQILHKITNRYILIEPHLQIQLCYMQLPLLGQGDIFLMLHISAQIQVCETKIFRVDIIDSFYTNLCSKSTLTKISQIGNFKTHMSQGFKCSTICRANRIFRQHF